MVRGVPNTVLEGRGRRQRKITKDLVDNYILNSKPVGSSVCTRGNSGKNGDRASFKPNIKGKSNASDRRHNSEKDDSDDESDDDDECPDEMNEKIENNTERINYVQDNIEVVLRLILSVLPMAAINRIFSEIKSVEADDHIMIQDFVNQVKEKNSENQGKNDVNVLNDPVNIASSTEGNAAATTAAAVLVEQTVPTASVTDNLPATIDQSVIIADKVQERLDDINRKKNIIVTGMSEDNDDDNMIREMFRVMGCENMLRDVVSAPTRLGARGRKNRAIKIEMRNELAVDRIMECKTYLKDRNENFYLVYINRDLSKSDRDKEIQLRRQRNRGFYDESAAGAGVGGGNGSQNRNNGAQISGTPNGGPQNILNGIGLSEGSKSQSSQNGALNQNRANEMLEMERRQKETNAEIDGLITHMRYGMHIENVEYWKGYKNDWVVHYGETQSRPEGARKDNLGNDQGRGKITQP